MNASILVKNAPGNSALGPFQTHISEKNPMKIKNKSEKNHMFLALKRLKTY